MTIIRMCICIIIVNCLFRVLKNINIFLNTSNDKLILVLKKRYIELSFRLIVDSIMLILFYYYCSRYNHEYGLLFFLLTIPILITNIVDTILALRPIGIYDNGIYNGNKLMVWDRLYSYKWSDSNLKYYYRDHLVDGGDYTIYLKCPNTDGIDSILSNYIHYKD